MTYLLDTGFLYALLNRTERAHSAVREATARIDAAVFLPSPVIVEVAYLIQRDLGAGPLADFVSGLSEPPYTLLEPTPVDYQRASEVIRQYRDAQIDLVDALIVSVAERLNIQRVLTLDQRHFRLFRPLHCDALELIP
jgi:predicted nucleic acid-binding protein